MSFARPRPAAFGLLSRVAAWPFRVAAARATLHALAAMDGRELADIGLTRSDLRDVSALALDRDPTALLAARARERRRSANAPPPPSVDVGVVPGESRPPARDRPRIADRSSGAAPQRDALPFAEAPPRGVRTG